MSKHFSDDAKRRIAKVVRDAENFGGNKVPPRGRLVGRDMPQTPFCVLCTVDGGAGGSLSSNASWTYTVTNFAGDITFGTTLTPLDKRQTNTKYWAQPDDSVGLGCWDENNEFKLVTAFEELEVGDSCEGGGS